MNIRIVVLLFCVIKVLFFLGCASVPNVDEMTAYEDFSQRSRQEMIADFKEQFEGQCLLKNIIPTICECKIFAVSDTCIILRGPGGNFTHKFNQKPKFSTGLVWYIITTGNNIGGIQVSDKAMALEIYHLLEAIYQKTPQGPNLGYISSIKATVAGLKFFESGPRSIPPYGQRKYTNEFVNKKPHYVYWELTLEYPCQNRRIILPLDFIFYDPQGRIVRIFNNRYEIKPKWTTSRHINGCGKKFRWAWSRGEYRVDVYFGEQEIASSKFTIK